MAEHLHLHALLLFSITLFIYFIFNLVLSFCLFLLCMDNSNVLSGLERSFITVSTDLSVCPLYLILGKILTLILVDILTFYHIIHILSTLCKKPFEHIVGKGENAGHQHFLLFLQCFLPCQEQILICCLQVLSIWTSLKFCSLVKNQMRYSSRMKDAISG